LPNTDLPSSANVSFVGCVSREGTNDPEPESSATDGRKRKRQQVSTLQARIKVVKWMVEDE
jgi:hypothetical protein